MAAAVVDKRYGQLSYSQSSGLNSEVDGLKTDFQTLQNTAKRREQVFEKGMREVLTQLEAVDVMDPKTTDQRIERAKQITKILLAGFNNQKLADIA